MSSTFVHEFRFLLMDSLTWVDCLQAPSEWATPLPGLAALSVGDQLKGERLDAGQIQHSGQCLIPQIHPFVDRQIVSHVRNHIRNQEDEPELQEDLKLQSDSAPFITHASNFHTHFRHGHLMSSIDLPACLNPTWQGYVRPLPNLPLPSAQKPRSAIP